MNTNHDALPVAWLRPSVAPHYYAPATHWGAEPPEPLSADEALICGWFPVFKERAAQPMPEAAAQGWKLVPFDKITPEMEAAGGHAWMTAINVDPIHVFRAMVAASPAAPEGAKPERCHAGRDGDCIHKDCPQLRDKEPATSGRHCPLDVDEDDEPPHPQPQAQGEPGLLDIPPALDVRRIMLKVVPDVDGDPMEVYAESVKEVEDLLSDMGQRLEDYELGIVIANPVREALAQHRAALEECVETVKNLQNAIYNIGGEHVIDLDHANDEADEAEAVITQANQVLGGGGNEK